MFTLPSLASYFAALLPIVFVGLLLLRLAPPSRPAAGYAPPAPRRRTETIAEAETKALRTLLARAEASAAVRPEELEALQKLVGDVKWIARAARNNEPSWAADRLSRALDDYEAALAAAAAAPVAHGGAVEA